MLVRTRKNKHHQNQKGAYTHRNLLKDLSEIKSVLEIETKLKKALLKLAVARQAVGLQLSF
jgi:hypothetical protein